MKILSKLHFIIVAMTALCCLLPLIGNAEVTTVNNIAVTELVVPGSIPAPAVSFEEISAELRVEGALFQFSLTSFPQFTGHQDPEQHLQIVFQNKLLFRKSYTYSYKKLRYSSLGMAKNNLPFHSTAFRRSNS